MSKQYSCRHCDKEYTRKSAYDNHIVICTEMQTIGLSKREKECAFETETNIPNAKDMYLLLQHFATLCNKLAGRVDTLEKAAGREIRKIPVIPWLNSNIHPTVSFESYVNRIELGEVEEAALFVSCTPVANIFGDILGRALARMEIPSICTVSDKVTGLHMWDKTSGWSRLNPLYLSLISSRIHQKMLGVIQKWRDSHKVEMKQSDKLCIHYNERVSKIMSAEFVDGCRFMNEVRRVFSANITKVDVRGIELCDD